MDLKVMVALTETELKQLVNHIGHTPLQPISLTMKERAHTVYLKLEGANPTGSMKDRTGYTLIQQLEDQAILHKDSIIVESTSGNLGAALALLCKAKGYRFLAIIDPKTTQENISKMQSLGAQIEIVTQPDDNGGYLLSRLARVQELCARSRDYVWTNQYANPANPYIHYTTTGPEIYQQMNGEVDAIFVPVSTGGTLAGIGRYFREVSPSTLIIGVDAYGSVVFGSSPAPRKLTGIGSSRRSNFISTDFYDSHILVRDNDAFTFCRTLYSSTGIMVGGSSGAVLAACKQYLSTHPDITRAVCVCPDHGKNYLSTIFDATWIQQQMLDDNQKPLEDRKDTAFAITIPTAEALSKMLPKDCLQGCIARD